MVSFMISELCILFATLAKTLHVFNIMTSAKLLSLLIIVCCNCTLSQGRFQWVAMTSCKHIAKTNDQSVAKNCWPLLI